MKWIIIPAAAVLAFASVPAGAAPSANAVQLAQRDKDHDKGPDKGDHKDHNPPPSHTGPVTGPAMQTGPHRGPPGGPTGGGPGGPSVQQPPMTAPVTHVTTHHRMKTISAPPKRFDWSQYHQGETPPKMRHLPEIDLHHWQQNLSAEHHFHGAPYHRPDGWYYRRWVFGMVLPTLFWTQNYWIDDYWDYDLPDPPYGYVWVRYGDDALLVNVRTGYVLQAEYDLFD
ncbi:MAG TPA: RcnB family protein [Rhizomicrobium sp.]|nr:RcnB family protein [Rhizomicrobium sp.]